MCLVDSETERAFRGLYADFAFFSTKSLSWDGIISDCSREEITVRNAMLENAAKKVFLCHSGKFGGRSAYRQCSLEDVDYLVTEGACPEVYAKQFPKLKIL
jgi:DeoR/GlpR family transcriptional regulator of sugar metabolism